MSEELWSLTIAEAGRRIAARDLSPVEYLDAILDRIDRTNNVLSSYLLVTADRAREQAKRAEAEIGRGEYRGPMHGIPFALKDIYDTAGIRTTGHSARCADRLPEADAASVAKLYEAGAVLLGKLATHEFATGGPSYDLPWPPARNPWKLDRFPGGSSSGSGAAVAAGLAPMALGSDTGGSIRLPAAFCGVAGIKPTYGRVSKRGVLPLSWTMDNCGPLAWTVEDCAIALQAIAGYDPLDPCSVEAPVPNFRATLSEDLRGVKIGLVRHFYETDSRASDEVVRAMDAAIGVLTGLGAEVREIVLAPLADYQSCFRLIAISESFAIHGEHLKRHPEEYGEVLRYRIIPGQAVTAVDYVQALRQQRIMQAEMLEAMRDVDVLVTATAYGEGAVMAGMRAEANFANPPLTPPFNVSQMPALSLCNGFSASGLPLSMQIAARPFDEATVFRVGHAYEAATPWRDRRPQVPAAPIEDVPIDQVAKEAAHAARAEAEIVARGGGLDLHGRQFDQFCEALPHVDTMRRRLRRSRSFLDEPANVFAFPRSD